MKFPLQFAEGERVDSRSHDDIGDVDTSHTSSPEKTQGREAYVSSVGTVALWVSTFQLNLNCLLQ